MKIKLLYDFRGYKAGDEFELEADEAGELLDSGFFEVVLEEKPKPAPVSAPVVAEPPTEPKHKK